MSLDIVHIAINQFTDHVDFEVLATEIMREEGYTRIKPLGGVADLGRDAQFETFKISEGKVTTVFQYSLQDYVAGKIDDTIEKLKENKIEYHQLVLVTPHPISTQRTTDLEIHVRKNYEKELKIFDQKTLHKHLSNYDNGIFHRHFPDINTQIKELMNQKMVLLDTSAEPSLLRASIAFQYNDEAPRVRNSIFDAMVLSSLSKDTGKGIATAEILAYINTNINGLKVTNKTIDASIERLKSLGSVQRKHDTVFITETGKLQLIELPHQADVEKKNLVTEIIEKTINVVDKRIPFDIRQIIERNTEDLLIQLFRLFGISISRNIFLSEEQPPLDMPFSAFLDIARRDIEPQLAELLISSVAEVFSQPNEDQAKAITEWGLSYLGLQIMRLDPQVNELNANRIGYKTFVLDTDFILDCIVSESPKAMNCLSLTNQLSKYGCRVIIPEECIAECVLHAKISPRTYSHFGVSLISMSESQVNTRVTNAFVKGYYYARKHHHIGGDVTFAQYLSNYHVPDAAIPFMKQLVMEIFEGKAEVVPLEKLVTEIPLKTEEIEHLSKQIYKELKTAPKSEFRTELELQEMSLVDAQIYLFASHTGKQQISKGILGGNCYLLTSSVRYRRCAENLGEKDIVSSKPQSMIALFSAIGDMTVQPVEFVRLFDNPLLTYAVDSVFGDVETLLRSGVNLMNTSLVRLRYDLDSKIHNSIIEFNNADTKVSDGDEATEDEAADKFAQLLIDLKNRQYPLIEPLDALISSTFAREKELKNKEKELNKRIAALDDFEDRISLLGKRKQKYLRRMAQKLKNQ